MDLGWRGRLPFVVVALAALPLAWLPPSQPAALQTVSAVAMTGVIAAMFVLIPWDRTPPWLQALPALFYLVVVALLREAQGGAVSGYSPLVLLPLFWVALYGRPIDLGLVSIGIALVLGLPIVLIGEPAYPPSEWRRLILWLLIAPTVGAAVQGLVNRVRDANVALEAVSRTDPLTGLPNRREWNERIDAAVARARRDGTGFHIALIDIDHFKRFNDTYGHQVGDELLAEAAEAWRGALRAVDTVARWGGEEFAVLLSGGDARAATATLERLRQATPRGQTVSIGVAGWARGEDPDVTTSRADVALYEAKGTGRDRVVEAAAVARSDPGRD